MEELSMIEAFKICYVAPTIIFALLLFGSWVRKH